MVEDYDIIPPPDLKTRLGFLSMTPNLTNLSFLWETLFLPTTLTSVLVQRASRGGKVKLHSQERHNPHSQAACVQEYRISRNKSSYSVPLAHHTSPRITDDFEVFMSSYKCCHSLSLRLVGI